MRTLLVAGNWKMNTTVDEAVALVDAMRADLDAIDGVERVVCPPFVSLVAVREQLAGSAVRLGAQNMYFEPKGAFTGEVSPLMLAGLVDYVILGHSERRHIFGETDELVNRKVRSALAHGLRPILCVGETLAENEAGRTEEVVSRQLRLGLAEVPSLAGIVLAYEPVWAIGTGRHATPADAARVHRAIRTELGRMGASAPVPILYGGSVNQGNVLSLLAEPEIEGVLVGGASLDPEGWGEIVGLAS